MPLNRTEVEKHVRTHWFTPCDDGVLLSRFKGQVLIEAERKRLQREGKLPGEGWKAVLLPELDASGTPVPGKERGCFIRPNPRGEAIVAAVVPPELKGTFDIVVFYQVAGEHDGLVDCAHYVSRVLTAGGVRINHPGVPGLVQELRARKDTRTLGLEISRERGERILDAGVMKFGDVICYFHVDPKTNARGYSHSAVYTGLDDLGLHRISCHTTARFNSSFDNSAWNITEDPSFRYTLIHFVEDIFPPIPSPLRLQVTQGSRTEVYELKAEGKVQRARGNASSKLAFGVRAEDNGYWFVRGVNLFVFWPRSGQVAKIAMTSFVNLGGSNFVDGIDADVELL